MEEIVQFGNFKGLSKHKNKKQIVLCHTAREVGEYLTSLRFRHNENFERVPHFIVTREGKILQLLKLNETNNFFGIKTKNSETIVVCLENLGWLMKKPLSTTYLNWIGNIYNEEVYEKRWRDYGLWQPYPQIQIEKTVELCRWICQESSIPRKFVGHNTKVDGIELFQGICTRSNFDQRYTDLSPAFDFNTFKKNVEYEEFDEHKI